MRWLIAGMALGAAGFQGTSFGRSHRLASRTASAQALQGDDGAGAPSSPASHPPALPPLSATGQKDGAAVPSLGLSALAGTVPTSGSAGDASQGSAAEPTVIHRCMAELDAQVGGWRLEEEAAERFLRQLGRGEACSMVIQHDASFDAGDGEKVPFLRAVGYFPGAAPRDVLTRMSEPKARRRWDSNYVFFTKFQPPHAGGDGALPPLFTATRPFREVARRYTECTDDACRMVMLMPATTVSLREWLAHKVGNKLLHRVGLSDRLMSYERVTLGYGFHRPDQPLSSSAGAAPPAFPHYAYDVIYNGSRQTLTAATAASPAYRHWLAEIAKSGSSQLCDVNYQHMLLLPIMDPQAQLLDDTETFTQLCRSGSLRQRAGTAALYNVMLHNTALAEERMGAAAAASEDGAAAETPPPRPAGTLLLMTSANNVGIPPGLPQWFKTRVMNVTSGQAYANLFRDLSIPLEEEAEGANA